MINVLSLFDGMSCAQIALNKLGIKDYTYYASEVKPHAIKTTQENYPKTIQLGDVKQIKSSDLPEIDLLIGGSPCQDFSQANKDRPGLEGVKSGLFYEYLRILKECKPKHFLLENVKMKKEHEAMITEYLGVNPVNINSKLISAQLRNRYYWTNITNIGQPEDKNILLQDVLTEGWTDREKARCLLESDSRPLSTPVKMFHRYYSTGFTTLIFKDKAHYLACKNHYDLHYKGKPASEIGDQDDDWVYDGLRYLNKKEREALQTVPTGYTDILTKNETACLLGDGFTVDVIAHILKGLKCTT